MNFLFRTFILFGLLLVVALFAALLAPYWIDWKQFTREFEVQASRAIGQPVRVGGEANLRILPLPFISFEDLEVGRNTDGTPLMTVSRFSLRAELLPFLSGEVRIVDMAMLRPHLNLRVEENGTVAWTTPEETIVDPDLVKIEKLSIEDGSADLSGFAQGRTLQIAGLGAELSARTILGPWRIDGQAQVENVPTTFSMSTGSFLEDQRSMRFKADLSRLDQPYSLTLDGPVSLKEDILTWSGRFGIKPVSGTELRLRAENSEPLPFEAEGQFEATPRVVQVPEYRLEIGDQTDPYVVTGRASAQIREQVTFRIEADGRQIDLDRIENGATGDQKPALERRLAALRSVVERIPVPKAGGEISILLPAIVAGDTFIRDVRASVRPFEQGWDVRSFSASFPGNTLLEASGRVGLFDDFGFAGKLLVASRQPSGFAAWLSGDVSPQIRRLQSVGMDASATISPKQFTLDNLELRLDDALLKGRLQRLSGETKPAIIAELSGNIVNTENLRALYSLARGQEQDDLVSHDLNITLNAERLESVFRDIPILASDVTGQVQVRDGSVSVERFQAGDFAGARITSSGRIENILQNPNGNMTLEVSAKDGTGIIGFMDKALGETQVLKPLIENADISKDFVVSAELDSTASGGDVKAVLVADGELGGTVFRSRSGFNGPVSESSNLAVDLDISLSNDVPASLMRQVGLETAPDLLSENVAGPLKLSATMKGSEAGGFDVGMLASAPGTSVSSKGKVLVGADTSGKINFETTFGSSDIMPWFKLFGMPLPVEATRVLPSSAKFMLDGTAETLLVKQLDGQVGGNSVSGNLVWQNAGVARPKLEGDLAFSRLDVGTIAETVFGRYDVLGLGDDILAPEDLSFGTPPYAGYDARINLTAETITLGETLNGTNASADFGLIDGELDLTNVQLQTLGGEASGSISLKNTEGTVLARGNFFVAGADVATSLELAGVSGDPASGTLQATGSFEGAGKSVSGIVTALSGNGFAKLENAEINGVDPSSLDSVLAAADQEGFEVNTRNVIDLIDEYVLKGSFVIGDLDAPFSVNRGAVEFRNIGHETASSRLSADVRYEILSGNIEAEYTIAFDPDRRNAISGSDPQVTLELQGPVGAMERQVDVSLLEGYLSLRAFEISQRRVETLEARVIEKQRHLRQIAYSRAREQYFRRVEEERQLIESEQELRRINEAVRNLENEQQRRNDEALRAQEEAEAKRLQKEREEAARKAAEAAATPAPRPATNAQNSGSGNEIETSPLPRLGEDREPPVAPSLRENIIQNLENFLRGG